MDRESGPCASSSLSRARRRQDQSGRRVGAPPRDGLRMARGCTSSRRLKVKVTSGASDIQTAARNRSPVGPTEEEGLVVEQERPIHHHLHWGARERHLDPRCRRGTILVVRRRDRLVPLASVLWSPTIKPSTTCLRHKADASPGTLAPHARHRQGRSSLPRDLDGLYDVSPDGKQVVYTNVGPDGKSQLWLAPMDRSSPRTANRSFR